MADRKDPYRKFRFKVECDGVISGGFSEVSGVDATVEVTEYREGNEVTTPRKLPGLVKYGNLTLKRGVTDSMEFINWIYSYITSGELKRQKMLTIIAQNEKGEDVATFQVINAWPTKFTGPDFAANSSEVSIETLEIVHEGLTRTK